MQVNPYFLFLVVTTRIPRVSKSEMKRWKQFIKNVRAAENGGSHHVGDPSIWRTDS
jgi:hypothetical protein